MVKYELANDLVGLLLYPENEWHTSQETTPLCHNMLMGKDVDTYKRVGKFSFTRII